MLRADICDAVRKEGTLSVLREWWCQLTNYGASSQAPAPTFVWPRGVLVQPELESWRSPLASEYTAIFAALWEDFTFYWLRGMFLWLGGKHLDDDSAELSVNFVLTCGHDSLLLDLYYWPITPPGRRHSGGNPHHLSRGTAQRLAPQLFTRPIGDESAVVPSPLPASDSCRHVSPADTRRACLSMGFSIPRLSRRTNLCKKH
jgi:hypothetical protein